MVQALLYDLIISQLRGDIEFFPLKLLRPVLFEQQMRWYDRCSLHRGFWRPYVREMIYRLNSRVGQ
jgi:hypothetical protein